LGGLWPRGRALPRLQLRRGRKADRAIRPLHFLLREAAALGSQSMGENVGYQNILIERRGAVGIVTFNRPQALNALNAALISELNSALDDFEADAAIGAIVLTGSEKAFAAGADVKEMASKSYPQIYLDDFITRGWERVG